VKFKLNSAQSTINQPFDANGVPNRVQVVLIPDSGCSLAPTPSTAAAAQQFNIYISRVIHSLATEPMKNNQLIVACAVAFEMLHREDLLPFLNQLQAAETLHNKVYVSWATKQGRQRRELSSFTLIAFGKCTADVDWTTEIATFNGAISTIYDFGPMTPQRHRTLDTVFLDLQAWVYLHMPMPLVADYLNVLPITPLQDNAWHRRYNLTLANSPDGKTKLRDEFQNAEGQIVEAILESPTPLSGAWIIDELSKVCSGIAGVGVGIGDMRAWRQLVVRLSRVARGLKRAGPVEALFVGWAVHLVRYGSARRAIPKVSTLARYLSAALRPIYFAIRATSMHPFDLGTKDWNLLFSTLLEGRDDDSTFRSAVVSFHSFLVRTIDAEPQYWLFRNLESDHSPRANVIWPHEIDALPGAIMRETNDERMGQQVITWSFLLTSIALRISELKWIRLSDFEIIGGQLELHIVSRRFAGSGKTSSASRICYTRDLRCIETLVNWRNRREKEGAELNDLIFGDPHDNHKLFRMGASYSLLNRCLKIVTGDEDFSSHLCRHTVISVAIEQAILGSSKYLEINPIHQIQVQAGHKSAETTVRTYFHLPENCRRHWVDHALRKMNFPYKSIGSWAQINTATLSQRVHRRKNSNWNVIDAVQEAAAAYFPVCLLHRNIPTEFATSEKPEKQIALKHVVKVVQDCVLGYNIESICLRNSMDEDSVRVITQAANQTCGCSENSVCDGTDNAAAQVWADSSGLSKFKVNFTRLCEARWTLASKSAALQTFDDLTAASRYWHLAVRGGSIALLEIAGVQALLKVIKQCGLGVNRMVVRVNGDPSDDARKQESVSAICQVFTGVYGIAPQTEITSFRRGRPLCYLQILTNAIRPNQVAAAASNDTKTLNALMFSICVLLKLQTKGNGNADS